MQLIFDGIPFAEKAAGFMKTFLEQVHRWGIASMETYALLRRNGELLARRAELIRTNFVELRDLLRTAREFSDRSAGENQEPAARSTSPRSR